MQANFSEKFDNVQSFRLFFTVAQMIKKIFRKETNVSFVDPDWYLSSYPDVAAAGVDPKRHFQLHGRLEGRLPCFLPAIPLERDLWANAFDPEAYLAVLTKQALSSNVNGLYAAKTLAEFYLFKSDYEKSTFYVQKPLARMEEVVGLINESTLFLAAFEAEFKLGKFENAKALLRDKRWKMSNSKLLAHQMLSDKPSRLLYLNKIYSRNRLLEINSSRFNEGIDFLVPKKRRFSPFLHRLSKRSLPLVSVIVPLYNAENTIKTAIESLLAQTWRDLEIIIVNDCSTDNSLEVVSEYADIPQVKLLSNEKNSGAYPARNKGLKFASGDLVTVMDADDWAHPQKIEEQVLPLIKVNDYIASVSHWVRCSDELHFTRLRADKSWIYRNISSLMIRRTAFDEIGPWDELKAGADTEFYYRLLTNFGPQSVVEVKPDVPLSLGRVHDSSLTQSSATHLATQFGGVRQEHLAFARIWHRNAIKPIKLEIKQCKFPVPIALCPQPHQRGSSISELERWRRAFNNQWYLGFYTDVDMRGQSIYDHFRTLGEELDYCPNPFFVPSAYRFKHNLLEHESPTWVALSNGWNFDKPIKLDGNSKNVGKHIAMFAHSISKQLFGAELSFLDMVKACHQNGYVITLFLPNAQNPLYVEELLEHVNQIIFIPFQWALADKSPSQEIINGISVNLSQEKCDLVYINTIMQLEPYIAARKASIPIVTHVRELPEHDKHIRQLFGETAMATKRRLEDWSDFFIVNSKFTANWLSPNSKVFVLPNRVSEVTDCPSIDINTPLKVCMLSSNTQKKGVEDFYKIANECRHSDIVFNLYGPETADLKAAELRFPEARVHKAGYVHDIRKAMSENDIVLCLSWFQESFGRTAAEAMINGRVVFGYDYGAITEVVGNSGGELFPFKQAGLIADKLLSISTSKSELLSWALQGRKKAIQDYSDEMFNFKCGKILETILSGY